jgi:hypothetical protein
MLKLKINVKFQCEICWAIALNCWTIRASQICVSREVSNILPICVVRRTSSANCERHMPIVRVAIGTCTKVRIRSARCLLSEMLDSSSHCASRVLVARPDSIDWILLWFPDSLRLTCPLWLRSEVYTDGWPTKCLLPIHISRLPNLYLYHSPNIYVYMTSHLLLLVPVVRGSVFQRVLSSTYQTHSTLKYTSFAKTRSTMVLKAYILRKGLVANVNTIHLYYLYIYPIMKEANT